MHDTCMDIYTYRYERASDGGVLLSLRSGCLRLPMAHALPKSFLRRERRSRVRAQAVPPGNRGPARGETE